MLRLVFVAALVGVLAVLPASPAVAGGRAGADLAVELDAVGALLLNGATYEVKVTNLGPEPLSSATVVVRLDPRAAGVIGRPPACPMDLVADTLTCSSGPLAPGASATLATWVLITLPEAPAEVHATAGRVASTPADPDPANDSASATCWNRQDNHGFPPHPYRLNC